MNTCNVPSTPSVGYKTLCVDDCVQALAIPQEAKHKSTIIIIRSAVADRMSVFQDVLTQLHSPVQLSFELMLSERERYESTVITTIEEVRAMFAEYEETLRRAENGSVSVAEHRPVETSVHSAAWIAPGTVSVETSTPELFTNLLEERGISEVPDMQCPQDPIEQSEADCQHYQDELRAMAVRLGCVRE